MKKNELEDSLNKIFSNSGYKMVDVSDKNITHRKALATGEIVLGAEVIKLIKEKKINNSWGLHRGTIGSFSWYTHCYEMGKRKFKRMFLGGDFSLRYSIFPRNNN